MKKILVIAMVIVMLVIISSTVMAAKPDYNTITAGELFYAAGHYLEGEAIPTGFDIFGYNYQGHMFSGLYIDSYLGKDGFAPYTGDDESYLEEYPGAETKWYWPYRTDYLMMKWNDAWLSNVDRDKDGVLDRHYGYDSYIDSGAWLTNHMSGTYVDDEDVTQYWNEFVKIVAVSSTDVKIDGFWFDEAGEEIGQVIWGEFALILDVYNDTGSGDHGVYYRGAVNVGLGGW